VFLSRDRPSWNDDGKVWPNRQASRFVRSAGLDWHVQIWGEGPDLLLLHGTGASSHSWRDVAPILARSHRVIVPDLPGHGFTGYPGTAGLSLKGMASRVGDLLTSLDAAPVAGIGHSAGAAVLVAMDLAGQPRFETIVSINGAFLPIRNASLFAPLAKLLFLNPVAPHLFALRGRSSSAVERLIEGTGSHIDARGLDLYRRLMQRSAHIEGALGMMANWDLDWLGGVLPSLETPLVLVTAPGDKAVPPANADTIARRVPSARHVDFGKGGHLVHEEYPEAMARLVLSLV
jgi:magnesium chelatase accessory protein